MKKSLNFTRSKSESGYIATLARELLDGPGYCQYVCKLYLNDKYKVTTKYKLKIYYKNKKTCEMTYDLIKILRHTSSYLFDEIVLGIRKAVEETL